MAAPVTHILIRIAPFPDEPPRDGGNTPGNYRDRLDVIAKAAITAAVLAFTGYYGFGFYEALILGNVRQCLSSGIRFVGGTLVSCYFLSELQQNREEAPALQHTLPI